jgi:hypothetical protein
MDLLHLFWESYEYDIHKYEGWSKNTKNFTPISEPV